MGVVALGEKITARLKEIGLNPVTLIKGEADQPGDYLIFAEQIIRRLPEPNIARFTLYIVRSDLEGHSGAYQSIDALRNFNVRPGLSASGASLHSYANGLYTYKASLDAIWVDQN
jgi:hypothetical protein